MYLLLVLALGCRATIPEPNCLPASAGCADASRSYEACSDGTAAWYELSDGRNVPCAGYNDCGAAAAETSAWCSSSTLDDTGAVDDTASDTHTDTDTDSGADTDTGKDTDTEIAFCDQSLTAPAPGGLAECVTDEIRCGDVVEASNAGGSEHYTKDHFEAYHCASTESTTAHYDAPERVYYFEQAPNSKATVKLEKECEKNLEMRILRHQPGDWCPSAENNLVFCDRDAAAGLLEDQDVTLTATGTALHYEIVIDGRNDAVANFRLSVTCP